MAPRLTHLALPCHNLDATIAWYEKYTPLRKTHHRQDALGAVAWLSPEELGIVLVFIQKNETPDPIPVLAPLAHWAYHSIRPIKSIKSLNEENAMVV